MTCYRSGGCGPYEMRSCNECPASKPEYRKREEQRMNSNTRINGSDGIMEIATKMCEGNPGALQVVM